MKILLATLILGSLVAHAAPDDEAYFRQFLYHRIDVNNDPDFPPKYVYYSLTNDWPLDVPLDDKQSLIVMYHIFMNDDGTWEGAYQDGLGLKGSGDWTKRLCRSEHGTWSVPDRQLEIRDDQGRLILIGSRATAQGKNAISMRYTGDFQTLELRGTDKVYVSAQSDYPKYTSCFP